MIHCLPTWKKLPFVMHWHVRYLVCFIFTCCVYTLQAQQVITGKVTSHDTALTGVTVRVKGSSAATQTDINGNFRINSSPNSTLVFSSIGYANQEIPVASQTNINVALNAVSGEINDVVVIGYQTIRRKDLTGATSVVNTENTSKILGNSVADQLQGQTPGVTVRTGGAPGQNSVIEIRGVASFRNSDPLYVIDGMIADANSTVNTDDIATIQILKDASAAAIYGSRAANGVIIITTKKGKSGPAKISASARYSIQQLPKQWDVMNASGYLKTVNTQYQNSNATLPAGIAAQIAANTVNTDWQDAIYRTGNEQDYNITMSGGSAAGNYLISGSYYKNLGILIDNDFERASLRVNTEIHKGILTIGENMVLSNSDGHNPGGGVNAFYEAPQMLPIIPVQSSSYVDPKFNPGGWGIGTNDIPSFANNYVANAALDQQTYNYGKVVGNAYADLKFTSWLSYRLNVGLEASFDYHKEVRDSGIWRYEDQLPATSIGEDRERFTNFLLEHTLNFNKSFGKHNINGVVGYSYQDVERQYTSGSKLYLQNVNGELFTTIISANGPATANGGIDLSDYYRLQGYLGRLNYNYADKYLLTFSGRIDQDSRFGPDYRTGDFYSAAGAWRISNESFFHVPWTSDLKLRGSYGKLGIDPLNAFEYLGVINNSPRAIYGVGQSPMVGEYTAQIVNPDLHWEERDEGNIGLDASLLNNRFAVSIDLYNNLSKGVLIDVPIGFYQGSASASATSNAASIRNKGIEATFTYNHHNSPFSWDISINGTTIKNTVESVGHQAAGINYLEGSEFSRSQVGHPMDAWFMLKAAGIFQSQDEINNYINKDGTLIQPGAKPGDIKYIDADGNGTIDDGDRQFLGSPWPKFQGGLQFNATYKQFTFNLQFVGVFGYKVYDDIRHVLDSYQNTNFRSDINPWTPDNTNTGDPRLGLETGDAGITSNNLVTSSRWLENGSYIRLRNVEIGYAIKPAILQTVGFNTARIFVGAQNLFTITKYKGLDPDVVGNGILLRGFDNGNWPSSRIITFGFEFNF